MADFKEEVRKVADVVEESFSAGENGEFLVADEAKGKICETAGTSVEDLTKAQDARDTIIAGLTLALGERGIKTFNENKDLNQVFTKLKIHKDTIEAKFDREKDIPDGKGGFTPRKGVSSTSYTANGQRSSIGQLKKVKSSLAEKAAELLK